MHAGETKIQTIIDNQLQYVIPLFQRPYSWGTADWAALWQDLEVLCEEDTPRNHFIGSVVTMPANSVPEGVTKYILIDGQQRLTTLLILLAVVRDLARIQTGNLADKIDDLLLKNRYQEGDDVYKLLPTQVDRAAFRALMDAAPAPPDSPLTLTYKYFQGQATRSGVGLEKLYNVVRNNLVLVSIVLDKDDNPYLIFESLNAKGRPLTQADLIRNFFFMRIHTGLQGQVYAEHWKPMQDRLGENLTEYIRHFLMRDGKSVRQSDIYFTLKDRVRDSDQAEVVGYLKEMSIFSRHYSKLLSPDEESRGDLRDRLGRLNRFEATTSYPFLLRVYERYALKEITAAEFASILDLLEGFLIRRFVCGVATNGLTKIFPALFGQANANPSLLEGVRAALRDKNFPRDLQFKEQFVTAKVYGGDRSTKAKLILERLEASFGHKESVDAAALTIEHIMPRTPTDWWRQHLGEDWEAAHEQWLDTVGNLTLTGYNSELSNSDFPDKKSRLLQSHVELNRYFAEVDAWDDQAIARHGEALADLALAVWPDLVGGEDAAVVQEEQEDVKPLIAEVLNSFGGEKERFGKGTRVFYRTGDGKLLNVKHSKRHSDYYWYGFHASLLEDAGKLGVTHIVFILVPDGFAAVPVGVVRNYIAEAGISVKSDGTVRHYHVLISVDAEPHMFHHGKPSRIPLGQYHAKFSL